MLRSFVSTSPERRSPRSPSPSPGVRRLDRPGRSSRSPSSAPTARSRSRSGRRRIVSLSPTATETLFAIGAGSQVVAVDDQSDFPKIGAADVALGLHAERRGDRDLPARPRRHRYDPKGLVGALSRLGITVLHQDGAKSFKGAYQQIRQLGLVTGREPRATRVDRA